MNICEFCKEIEIRSNIIYEDEDFAVFLIQKAVAEGHCVIVPKKHYMIFEQVSDKLLFKLGGVVNLITKKLLSELQITGTNIFVRNGIAAGQEVAHFAVHIIPRNNDDGIEISWEGKTYPEDAIKKDQIAIKENIKDPEMVSVKKNIDSKENYLYEQLNRKP
tara:strand:- start:1142 stop:1627 length:486 start_codon:yes stop_codon:yes gene_type:complete